MFFAIRGEHFDGNKFAEQALASGAGLAVADDESLPHLTGIVHVPDALTALQDLARHHRRKMHAKVIAITGSNGKTTSKELVASVLSTTHPTHASEGNLNNHLGVPLTLLKMKPEHRFAVIEMGANHRGEIAELCNIAEPEYGAVTNIGKAHLEGFGGLKGVIKAKKELFDYLSRHDGTAFVNSSLPHLEEMAASVKRKVTYGDVGDVRGMVLNDKPTLQVEIAWSEGALQVVTNLIGEYNLNNILLAATVGLHFQIPPEKIREGIESYVPSSNRSQVIRRGTNTIILDAYNANPSSMEAALTNLATFTDKHRVAILGDMLELGDYSTDEHERITNMAGEAADQVVLVGEEFMRVRSREESVRSRETTDRDEAVHFRSVQDTKRWVEQQKFDGAIILVKGSRKIGLEQLVDWLI